MSESVSLRRCVGSAIIRLWTQTRSRLTSGKHEYTENQSRRGEHLNEHSLRPIGAISQSHAHSQWTRRESVEECRGYNPAQHLGGRYHLMIVSAKTEKR